MWGSWRSGGKPRAHDHVGACRHACAIAPVRACLEVHCHKELCPHTASHPQRFVVNARCSSRCVRASLRKFVYKVRILLDDIRRISFPSTSTVGIPTTYDHVPTPMCSCALACNNETNDHPYTNTSLIRAYTNTCSQFLVGGAKCHNGPKRDAGQTCRWPRSSSTASAQTVSDGMHGMHQPPTQRGPSARRGAPLRWGRCHAGGTSLAFQAHCPLAMTSPFADKSAFGLRWAIEDFSKSKPQGRLLVWKRVCRKLGARFKC